MKKTLLSFLLILASLVCLGSCKAEAPGVTMADIAGCYSLVEGRVYSESGTLEELTEGSVPDGFFVFKLKENGQYLMLFDGASAGGSAVLSESVLSLGGSLSPFDKYGEPQSASLDFGGSDVFCVVDFEAVGGESLRLECTLRECGNYDDDYFVSEGEGGGNVDLSEVIGVNEDGYQTGEFTPDGIELVFNDGEREERVPLVELDYSISEHGSIGKVTVFYRGEEFSFNVSIISLDVSALLTPVSVPYTEDGYTYEPDLPFGYEFVIEGSSHFTNAGSYTIRGELWYNGSSLGGAQVELSITPAVVSDYPRELLLRADENGEARIPLGSFASCFIYNDDVFYRGESSIDIYLDANHVFESGESFATVDITVLPPLIDASRFVWVKPEDKIEFSVDWRNMMPYLTLDGEPLYDVTYSYTPDPGENSFEDFVVGMYNVTADLSDAAYEPDGEIEQCIVELVPRVLGIESVIQKIYTGNVVSAISDYILDGYAYIEGEYEALDVGSYTCTVRIDEQLYTLGLVCFAGTDEAEMQIDWSIAKEKILLTVDESEFNLGFDFEFDGYERRFAAYTNASVDLVMFVNGQRYESLDDFFFRTPGTYNVCIRVEDENLDADPYERTVVIGKKRITLASLGMSWLTGSYTFSGSLQRIEIDPYTIPDYIKVNYSGNEYTDSGSYTARATFSLLESREEALCYVITDPDYTIETDWSIARAVVSRPSLPLSTKFTYNGSVRNFFSASDLPFGTSVSGHYATDAGDYTLRILLSSNYCFPDGSDLITLDWSIAKKTVSLSSLALATDVFEWQKGIKVYPTVYNLDYYREYFSVTLAGDDGVEEPGSYSAKLTFALKDEYKRNYRFECSGEEIADSFELAYSFEIMKRYLDAPLVSGSYYYTGALITPTLSGFDESLMLLDARGIKKAGNHTVKVTLTDPDHYYFVDSEGVETDAVELGLTVNKATLTLGSFTQPIRVYDGMTHSIELSYIGVGGERYAARFTLTEDGEPVDCVLGAGIYLLKALGPADESCLENYEAPTQRSFTFSVGKATIDSTKLVWSFDEIVYDGQKHLPTVSGYPSELTPSDVYLSAGSEESRGGIHAYDGYVASVRFEESDNYNAATVSHNFKIKRRPVTPPVAVNTRFVYDGTQQALQYILNDSFGSYDCTVSNYVATNASVYLAMFIAGDDFIFKVGESEQSIYTITWEITKGVYDLSGIRWSGNDGGTYTSDGTVYDFVLEGLPEGLGATYSMNGVQRIGSYTKTATLVNKNPDNMLDPDTSALDLSFAFTVKGAVSGDYEYYVDGNEVYITAYHGTGAHVVLPKLISGLEIASVGSAFKNHSEIISLDISSLADRYAGIDLGGLAGLSSLCELYLEGLDNGCKLSDLFGGEAPASLVALHLDSVAYEFMVKDIDSQYIKELYLAPGAYIDFADIPFSLRVLHLSSSLSTEIFNYDSVISVPCLYNGTYRFARGRFDYPFYFSPVEFTAGIKQTASHMLVSVDGLVYLIEGESATLMHSRGTGALVIPESIEYGANTYSVTGIAKSALSDRTDIHTLTVPKTVKNVGSSAFANMSGLKTLYWNAVSAEGAGSISIKKRGEVIFGDSVLTLPDSFLANSHGLFEVVLPDTVVGFGKDIFKGSKNLLTVSLSNALDAQRCGTGAFTDCSKLVEVYDPAGVAEELGLDLRHNDIVDPTTNRRIYNVYSDKSDMSVYRNSDGLWLLEYGDGILFLLGYDGSESSVSMPSTDRTLVLASYAFYMNEVLCEVNLSGISVVNVYAFAGCENLTAVSFSSSIKEIDSYAFYACSSLKSIILPDSITYLGGSAFRNCTSLQSFRAPLGVIHLPAGLLRGCTSLSSIDLHSSVAAINSSCFMDCKNLTSFRFPEALEFIGESAFAGTGLTFIEIPAGIEFGTFVFSGSALVEVRFQYGVTETGGYMFSDCLSLERVILPAGFETISVSSFWGCTSLVTVSMPSSVRVIGASAFYGCESLQLTSLPASLEYIGDSAFEGASKISFSSIPSGVCYVGSAAFKNTGLGEKTEDGLWIVGGWIYSYEPEYTVSELVIPEGVIGIAGDAFRRIYVGSVVFSDTVLYVMPYAFAECNLASVTLSENLRFIGAYAFNRCEYLSEVVIPDSVIEIGEHAFSGCVSLGSVSLGSGVKKIGMKILSGCTSLATVSMSSPLGWTDEVGNAVDLSTPEKRIEHFTSYTMDITR